MTTYLLDTNVCIAWLRGDDPALRDRFRDIGPRRLRLCSVVKAELLYGARKSMAVDANLSRLARFFAAFRSWPVDDEVAEWAGIVRADLERAGTPIGANDLLIAATAKARGATVITRNCDEFRRVPGLPVEVW